MPQALTKYLMEVYSFTPRIPAEEDEKVIALGWPFPFWEERNQFISHQALATVVHSCLDSLKTLHEWGPLATGTVSILELLLVCWLQG